LLEIFSPAGCLSGHTTNSVSLSILAAIFPGGPGITGTRMSPFWILLELRMMEVVVTTGAIRRAQLQSDHHPPTNQHPTFYRPDVLPVA